MKVKNKKIKSSVFTRNIKTHKKAAGKKLPEKKFSVKESILDLKKDMNSQKEDILDLKKGINYLTVVTDQIRGDFKDFKSELALVRQKGDATFEEVGKLRVEMTEVKEEITGIKKEIKIINNRLDGIEAEAKITNNRLSNIEFEIKSIKNEINELKLYLTKKVDVEEVKLLEKRVVEIEGCLKK